MNCPACGSIFTPRRKWQKFCTTPCRKRFHASMAPEVLRREIDELKSNVARLEAQLAALHGAMNAIAPYPFPRPILGAH